MASTPPAAAIPDSESAVRIFAPRSHLPLRLRLVRALDDDQLFAFCAENRELRIERSAGGEILITSPTGGETGRRSFALTGQLFAWIERGGGGVGFDSSTGFILSNGAERSPDLAWVSQSRWDALTPEQRRKFVPLCPDFVLELRSPSDELSELQAKMDEYLACGAQLGWLIDADAKRVYVYRPGEATLLLEQPSEVGGDPVLHGFSVRLDAIY